MNEQDSLQMKGLLSRIGYTATSEPREADLILINTCSIREKAVHKLYSDLGRMRPLAELNPDLIVGVAGCVAQQEKENLAKRYSFLDLVFGPDAIRKLPDMVAEVCERKRKGLDTAVVQTRFDARSDFEFVNLIVPGEENRVSAYVNIQKGCDNVCSFCIVPQVRGREVSRPSAEIIDEIKALVDMGVKDVTLLGQNVNSYGLKNSDEIGFSELLDRIANKTSLKRLRFMTSHPKDVGDDLAERFRDLEILCPFFHLPVQSGSDRILGAMKRRYTRNEYVTLIEKLKMARSDLVFSTDVIVGFPGEEESDFNDTLDLLEEVGFDSSFSFVYSPRPKTLAVWLSDSVSDMEKKERLHRFQTRQREISFQKNQKLVGEEIQVLVENEDELRHNWIGRSDTNKPVYFPLDATNDKDLQGEFVKVRVTRATPLSLIGSMVILNSPSLDGRGLRGRVITRSPSP